MEGKGRGIKAMIISVFKQSQKLPTWIGGFLIQLQMSIVYVGIANIVMIAITMWYTSGHLIAEEYLPFVTLRVFLLFGAACWGMLIFLDYKYIAPAKQRHLNRQAAKHKNPVYELVEKIDKDNEEIRKDIAKIKEALNLQEGVSDS